MPARLQIILGERYGRLTVVEDAGVTDRGATKVYVLCDCGTRKLVTTAALRHKTKPITSCGCDTEEKKAAKRALREKKHKPGERYGNITVLTPYYGRNGDGTASTSWCRCDCGNELEVIQRNLVSGNTKSCGCIQKEAIRKTSAHKGLGVDHWPEHVAWHAMRQRCRKPKHPGYQDYGARGIDVCDEWFNSFEQFFNDVGPRPSKNHSLGRINNDIGYCPGNVRWETMEEQANNKRGVHRIKIGDETKSLTQWCEILHIPVARTRYLMKKGLTPWEALLLCYPRTRARREALGWNKPKHAAEQLVQEALEDSPPPPLTGTCADSVLQTIDGSQ